MKTDPSRRGFLAASLAVPAVLAQPGQQAQVQYRVLGKTGLRVTTVGYGTMITSDPSVIARALDMGINYFDTARNYQNGQNERMVGVALGARRKKIFLASKTNDNPVSGAGMLAELETSLKELNTDYVDVWHLHGMDSPETITDELMEALHKAKRQGKLRFMGVSTHNLPAIVDRAIAAKVEVVQAPYNFTSGAGYGPAIAKLHAAGVGFIAMKVMAKAGRRGAKRPENFGAAALKWVIRNEGVATTVPSMTDNSQLEENFRAMSERFGDADSKVLSARLEEVGPYMCRMCGQCTGQCPKGLPVSAMVRSVMYADGYGQFPLGREHYLRMTAEQQSVRCGDCATCAVECPNGVHVAARLTRAQELFA